MKKIVNEWKNIIKNRIHKFKIGVKMKKIVIISFVLFMAYIGLGLSVAQGNNDFVFENAQYMNSTGKDECIK